ncbi:MAG TPA: GGDEF and EAL domain-containing protein [Rhizomicrobium sp.]|nr:GGDEF and EAL domain-containing protein [Rhizomicrobium sp.]
MRKPLFYALIGLFLAGLCAAWAAAPPPVAVDFGSNDNVINLKPDLTPYHSPGGPEADGSVWYMVAVTNNSVRPAIRVLLAAQPPRMALRFFPHRTRPAVLAVASSDSGVVVEPAKAYGARAWRVIIPPVTQVGLALRVGNAATPPSLQAWTEPALASHNRQLAVFITAVGSLIAAAALITAGLAILIGHSAPRWVAVTLFMLLWSWLAGTGMFDASLATPIGGPYGLTALLTALALAAGAKLADSIVPVREVLPRYRRHFRIALYILCGLGALAYLGVPGATFLTDIVIIPGSAAIALYLIVCGRRGMRAAQVVAPSAAAFALVALAAAVTSLGALGETLTAPATTGGFAAAGAILLALAVIASEEIAVLPFLHGSKAARLLEAQVSPEHALDPAAPFANLALAAIGAAHQGVFDLDFRAQLLTLSADAALMLGLPAQKVTLSHSDWLARLHPEDREIYRDALILFREPAGQAFRLEFRARGAKGQWRWLELRASIVTEQDVPSDCLGLLSDITDRKEQQSALRDPLIGLGTRAALMETMAALGDALSGAHLALVDLDRFKAVHASLGDAGGDMILLHTARRLKERYGSEAQLFRIGGDGFALLFAQNAPASPQALGNALVALLNPPHPYDGRSIFAPASAGLASGESDPEKLFRKAGMALAAAKVRGGACALVYAPGLEAGARADSVALEADLRQALSDGHIEIFYQPIMRLAGHSVAGFEALLRWRHPSKGLIAPSEFIAHSEESGLIVELGRFALERAAQDLSHWQLYFPLVPSLFASVNLSKRQLRDPGFEELLAATMKANAIPPGTLILEVTESAAAADAKFATHLTRLKGLGAGLAIDDFGSGVSNLSQFRAWPFDTVKIDQSLMARHAGHETAAEAGQVLRSIITLAHDLKRKVVVEGVESGEDAGWLAQQGCEFGQGFYFSPPLSAADALSFIARHHDVTATS